MSIIDIAKEAGVSITTVSRFFNQPEKLSEDAARKIRATVDRMNYQPDIRRPGPKTAERVGIKTGNIAFLSLAALSPEQMLELPAFPILLGGVQSSLLAKHLTMLMAHIGANGRIPANIDSRNCDGVILFGAPENPAVMKELKRKLKKLPAVWCFRKHADPDHEFDHILYDNREVGGMAANYLASRGHRRIAIFNADPEHEAFLTRVEHFELRAKLLGLETTLFCPPEGFTGNQVQAFRYDAMEFLKKERGITGAFFCADDIMLGVHNELRALGFDTSKLDSIGCNADEILLRYLEPRPATIDIKMAEIGNLAVDHLLRRINGEQGGYHSEIFIKPELVPGK